MVRRSKHHHPCRFVWLRFAGLTGFSFATAAAFSRWASSGRALLFLRRTLLFRLRLRLRSFGWTTNAFALRPLLLRRSRSAFGLRLWLRLWPLLRLRPLL